MGLSDNLSIVTSIYPRTSPFLLRKSWNLYIYSIIYGVLAFFVMLLIVGSGLVKLEGFGTSNIWIQAIIVGISTKAFLHVRLFSVNTDSKSFPIGIETILQIFEPWLLTEIDLDEFNIVKEFVDNVEKKHSNLDEVKKKIIENIPSNLPKKDKSAFLLDLDDRKTVSNSMELYLRQFGKKSFNRVFPT